MKKFIVSISAVICLVISNLAILPVGAAEAPSLSDRFASTEFIQEHYGFTGDYFSYGYTKVNDYGDWYVEYSSVEYFDFSDSDIELITKENNNGIYTFETSYPVSMYLITTTYRSTDPDNIEVGYQTSGAHYTKFVYDSINDKIYLNDNQLFTDSSMNHLFTLFDIAGINNNPDNLDVRVIFSPTLEGEVDRSFTMPDGNKGFASSLSMFIHNNSSFPIQYSMSIYKANQVNFRPDILPDDPLHDASAMTYDDDPLFVYYSNEWVYYNDTTNTSDNSTYKVNKATSYHYLSSNSSAIVTFDYNQLNLTEGVEYKVVVNAIRNDYGMASDRFISGSKSDDLIGSGLDSIVKNNRQLYSDDLVTVYSSNFTMINYSDVKYDYSNKNNGVLPYDGTLGITNQKNYEGSRNALENEDGTIDYTSHNSYLDSSLSSAKYHLWQSQNNSSLPSYDVVLENASSVFGFFNSALSFFPSNLLFIFTVGFWTIILIAIIKAVK